MLSVSFPLTYRALGNEDLAASLVLVEKTVPSLQPNQLLIRVSHSSINYMDTGMQRRNVFQLPMPLVLGFDIAGEVAAVGEGDFGELTVGAKVLGVAEKAGGFAEYIVVPREYAILRHSVPSAEGSTYGIAFCTSYEGIEMELKVAEHSGQTILIPGAAGGCGHFAVQLAKRAGLRVIGTTSKQAGAALLKELGVDCVIDYSKQDVAAEVLAFTQGRGADLVWDSTYLQSSLEQSANLVAAGGVWCMLGTAQQLAMRGVTDYNGLFQLARDRGATATFSDYGRWLTPGPLNDARPNIRADILNAAIKYWEDGTVKPRITREVPFKPEALQQTLDEWKSCNVGKVVLRVD